MKLDYRLLAAAVLLVGACARPPLGELDEAWRAYQNASSVGAAEKAPERFQEAGAALVQGQDFIDQGDFDQARESLKQARRLADAAAGGQSGAMTEGRNGGLAEEQPPARPADAGFTEAPPSNEGVQLSPLVNQGGGARSAPVPAPAPPSAPTAVPPGAPPVAVPPPPAPPISATPNPPPPPTLVDGALPERILAPTPDAAPDTREFTAGSGESRSAPTPEDTARAIREEREHLKQAAAERAAAASAEPAPDSARAAAPPPPAPPPPAAIPAASGASRTYVVKKGDTLYSIARSQYQDESAWKQIYDANRDRLGNPGDVRAGMKLTIPPAGAAGASGSGAAPASAPSRGASTTYTVRKGENLHTIADKMYGSQSYWTLIRDANRDKLSDVDEVRAGTKLVLPPKPSSR